MSHPFDLECDYEPFRVHLNSDKRAELELRLPSELQTLFQADIDAFTIAFARFLLHGRNSAKICAALQHYVQDILQRSTVNEGSISIHEENLGIEADGRGWVHFTFDVFVTEGCRETEHEEEDQEEMFDVMIQGDVVTLVGREMFERPPDEF